MSCNACGKEGWDICSSILWVCGIQFKTDEICRGCFNMLLQAIRNHLTKMFTPQEINAWLRKQ